MSIRSANKFRQFIANLSLSSRKPHIISLTETWLDKDCDPAYYSIDGYNVYRTNRSALTSARSGGGGCLIAISSQLISSSIHINVDGVEHLFVKISNQFSKLIIGTAYISQECNVLKYSTHATVVEMLASRFPDYELLLCGDYNLPNITWPLNEPLKFLADAEALQC